MLMESESQASLTSNGIPLVESSVEETRCFDVIEGIDTLKNTKISDIFDEGKDISCDGNPMETNENDSKPSEEFEQQKGLKDADLTREEEDEKSDSLNVLDYGRTFEDITNGGTTNIHFENVLKEISREEDDEKLDPRNVLDDGRTFEDILNGRTTDIHFENALKEISSEEEDEKSNTLNVLDDGRTSENIPNGGTTDIYFENADHSQQSGEEGEENEQDDSMDNEEDAKMSQIEDRNEPNESDSTSMQDLVTGNSPREFINEDCCEENHLHQSHKIEGRSQMEDIQAIEDMEEKGKGQAKDMAMRLPTQAYELEPPAVVKILEPEKVVHQKSMENIASEIQNAVEEDVFHSEPESKILPMQTDAPSFVTKSNEYDAEKIHVDTDASLEFSSMPESESSSPFRCVDDPIHGSLPMSEDNPKRICEDSDMDLEYFTTLESNSFSGFTDNEYFNAESKENESSFTSKSDSTSLLGNEKSVSTESTDDRKSVSRDVEEINDFVIAAGKEALIVDQPLEMHIAEAASEKNLECEATNQDVYVAWEDTIEAEDTDSNANALTDECREQCLSLQENITFVSAIGVDKDQGIPNPAEENSPDCQSVTVSVMEHENQQSNAAEEEQALVLSGQDGVQVPSESGPSDEEQVLEISGQDGAQVPSESRAANEEQVLLLSGQDGAQVPSESGAADDHAINRQELSPNEGIICEQSLLEQQQLSLPLQPLEEKDSQVESDKDEQMQQQQWMESVELSFAIDQSELGLPRESVETVELPFATEEMSCTDDCNQVAESSVIERTEDTPREATDMDAGNYMQQNIETVESSIVVDQSELDTPRKGVETVELPFATDERSCMDDYNQVAESSVLEKTEDTPLEATDTDGGNHMEQYIETVESAYITDEMEGMYIEGTETVELLSPIDETERIPNECFKTVELPCAIDETKRIPSECFRTVELPCAIDETKGGIGVEATSDEQQPYEMIEKVSAIEKLSEDVREDQSQIKRRLQNGPEEMLKCTSLDENNVDDNPTTNLHEDSPLAVQVWTQINGEGARAKEPDPVDMTADYPSNDDKNTARKNESPAITVSQTPVQVSESLKMDNGLMENRLISDQQSEVKLQLNDMMAKTTSQMLPCKSFSEPMEVNQEQLPILTTEVYKNSFLTSISGTCLTHRGQGSQDLQIIEKNDSTLTVPMEKVLKTDAKRASVWDCCGIWDWLHVHED